MENTIIMWDALTQNEQQEYKRKVIDLIMKGYIESDMSFDSIENISKRMYYGDVKSKKVSY